MRLGKGILLASMTVAFASLSIAQGSCTSADLAGCRKMEDGLEGCADDGCKCKTLQDIVNCWNEADCGKDGAWKKEYNDFVDRASKVCPT